MAGSCAGLLTPQPFAETWSLRNALTLPAANFQLVTVRVLEEKRVVAGTVIGTDFRSFERLAAGFADQFCHAIYFFAGIRPKGDPRAVWPMVLVLCEPKKFRWPAVTASIKRVEIFARAFVNKSELRQKFSVELLCHIHVFHPQINVIVATRLHFLILNSF